MDEREYRHKPPSQRTRARDLPADDVRRIWWENRRKAKAMACAGVPIGRIKRETGLSSSEVWECQKETRDR